MDSKCKPLPLSAIALWGFEKVSKNTMAVL
jgi:hypothetical protein